MSEAAEFEDAFVKAFPIVAEFTGNKELRERTWFVANKLPEEIRKDLFQDPHFRIAVDDCEPGKGRTVKMPTLNANGQSRCVVLKPRLAFCQEAFAHYIIAHEFAHAFLRNGGWGEITDREVAADSLAASWGFSRPNNSLPWLLWLSSLW